MGKIEIKHWPLVGLLNDRDPAELEAASNELVLERHREMGISFQAYLFGLVKSLATVDPVVVETGVYSGMSTYFILQALGQRVDSGVLISIDPKYTNRDDAIGRVAQIELRPYWKGRIQLFNKWEFVSGKSLHVLSSIVEKYPEWDIFVHDSDHSVQNMHWELSFALKHVKPGGLIVIDDPTGDHVTGVHNGAETWLAQHPDIEWSYIGGTILARVPGGGELKLPEPPPAPPVVIPLTELQQEEAAYQAEFDALAAQEAELAQHLAANPPPPLPGVVPEVFEQPVENLATAAIAKQDADLDALIDGSEPEGEDGEDGDEDDEEPEEDSKGRQ
jgi:predicted O-methyltransferase YrrM